MNNLSENEIELSNIEMDITVAEKAFLVLVILAFAQGRAASSKKHKDDLTAQEVSNESCWIGGSDGTRKITEQEAELLLEAAKNAGCVLKYSNVNKFEGIKKNSYSLSNSFYF